MGRPSVRFTFANERRGGVHLDHGEPAARGRNGIALPHVGLLPNPQRLELHLEGAAIDDLRGSKLIFHGVFHRSFSISLRLHVASRRRKQRINDDGYARYLF
jgi:hypothetical protein